jgi:hypothetical protein
MTSQDDVRILQALYAGALADAVVQMGREGILEKVTEMKKPEQLREGADRARRMGMRSASEVPTRGSEIFGCTAWKAEEDDMGFSAETRSCTLCAMTKRMGGPKPCAIYCLNPMEGMIKGLDPSLDFIATETLWEGAKCRIEAKRRGQERSR